MLGQVEPYILCDQASVSQPPSSLRYIEEEDPEWRDLDYDLEVGHPPHTFCQFYLQHDCGVFTNSQMARQVVDTEKEMRLFLYFGEDGAYPLWVCFFIFDTFHMMF